MMDPAAASPAGAEQQPAGQRLPQPDIKRAERFPPAQRTRTILRCGLSIVRVLRRGAADENPGPYRSLSS